MFKTLITFALILAVPVLAIPAVAMLVYRDVLKALVIRAVEAEFAS